MWMSGTPNSNGWVSLTVQFPHPVPLNGLGVHTQFAGVAGAADMVQVGTLDGPKFVSRNIVGMDDRISFGTTTASDWKFSFHTTGAAVVVRGLQFFTPDGEIFPHYYPIEMIHYPEVTTQFGETHDSKVNHVIGPVIAPDDAATKYQPETMWHSGHTNSLGWVSLEVIFPYPVTLDRVQVHTQHSGKFHAADLVQIEQWNGNQFVFVKRRRVKTDDTVPFSSTKAQRWKIAFHSTDNFVVVRGLRFHSPSPDVYPDRPDAIVGP
jgi:hypothetical protein